MAWNGSENKGSASVPKKTANTPPSKWRGLIALVVVVVAGGLAAWFVMRSSGRDALVASDMAKPSQIAEVKPQIVTNAVVEAPKESPRRPSAEVLARSEKMRGMTPEERRQFIFEEMKKKPIDLTPTTNMPFRTGIEMSMARIFMTELGDMPPPLMTTFIPIQNEAHLAEILIANNPVIEGDSEKIKEAKAMVELAKKELRDYIKDGGDAASFMTFYHSKLVDAHQERMEAARQIKRVAQEDPEIAREYMDQVNKHLQEKGIKEVVLPAHLKQKLNLED